MPNKRRIPDLRWLRLHLKRVGLSRGRDLSDDVALVEFALQIPSERWRRISQTFEQRRFATNEVLWARRTMEGTAVPMLRGQLRAVLKQNDVLARRLAIAEATIEALRAGREETDA